MFNRKAFTAIELMFVVVVVGIVICFSTSGEDNAGKEQIRLATEKIESDVSYARRASIARPDDPLVIKVEPDNNRYWLARASSPGVPIAHPVTKKPYLVSFGSGGNTGWNEVALLAANVGEDQTLAFNSTGSTDQSDSAMLQLSAGGAVAEVSVAPSCGDSESRDYFSLDLGFGLGGGSGGGNDGGGAGTVIGEGHGGGTTLGGGGLNILNGGDDGGGGLLDL